MLMPPLFNCQFIDDDGTPLDSGLLYTYDSGTTTPRTSYADQGGASPNANPIVLDSAGRCNLWLTPDVEYRLLLKRADATTVFTRDDVAGSQIPGGSSGGVQYNNGGALAGDADFMWNSTTNVMTLGSVATPASIKGTAGTASEAGAALSIAAGAGGSAAGVGGTLSLAGGAASATNVAGGQLTLAGGAGNGTAAGGAMTYTGGAGGATGNGGAVTVQGGAAGATSGNGGAVTVQGGTVTTSGDGGSVNITASAGVGTNKPGGNVVIRPGAATGTGNPGNIQLDGGRNAALATTAIGGFVTVPTCAGTPTGVPVNVPTGSVAMVFDTTGNKIWFYDTAWIGVVVA